MYIFNYAFYEGIMNFCSEIIENIVLYFDSCFVLKIFRKQFYIHVNYLVYHLCIRYSY
jgi:hypothetical protein